MVIEILSKMLKREKGLGWISGFKIEGNGDKKVVVCRYLYVDDTLLLCEAKKEQFLHLRGILLAFEAVTDLKINLSKSSLFSIDADSNIEELADIMGCKVAEFPTVYLSYLIKKESSMYS